MIRRLFPLLVALLFFLPDLSGQGGVTGLWEGTLTEGDDSYVVKMDLRKKGRYLSGSSLVILSDTSYIELQVDGLYHEDRSMNVYEVKVLYPTDYDPDGEVYMRTYQLLYSRSFNDYFMEGWWQEEEKAATDETRRFGRIQLQKVLINSKA